MSPLSPHYWGLGGLTYRLGPDPQMMLVGCGWSEPSAFWAWSESAKAAAGAAAIAAEGAAVGAGAAAGENGALRSVLMAFMEFPFNAEK